MLASGIALGITAGLAFGGRLERLGRMHVDWWPLLLVAVLLRVAVPLWTTTAYAAYVTAFALVVAVALLNHAMPGMRAVAVGAGLNLLVVAANGGMPVSPTGALAAGASIPADGLHHELSDHTQLVLLADVIPVALIRGVYSVGDCVLALGGFWLPFVWLRQP